MKGQVASALIATALIAGLGVGYIWGTSSSTTAGRSQGEEHCTVKAYAVWSIESIHDSATVGGTTTSSEVVTTFQTTGYPSTTTNTYTGTLTGALASWNGTTCS